MASNLRSYKDFGDAVQKIDRFSRVKCPRIPFSAKRAREQASHGSSRNRAELAYTLARTGRRDMSMTRNIYETCCHTPYLDGNQMTAHPFACR
jgi:hypothetical protein